MKSIKTQLAFAARLALAMLVLAAMLLLVARDLYELISPARLLLGAALGVLLLVLAVSMPRFAALFCGMGRFAGSLGRPGRAKG